MHRHLHGTPQGANRLSRDGSLARLAKQALFLAVFGLLLWAAHMAGQWAWRARRSASPHGASTGEGVSTDVPQHHAGAPSDKRPVTRPTTHLSAPRPENAESMRFRRIDESRLGHLGMADSGPHREQT